MNRKSRTVVGILTATVLTGAGVATMANAVALAQPTTAPTATVTPMVTPTGLPADEQRTAALTRSVDDLLAQVGVLEQAVAAGTPVPSATAGSGRDGSSGSSEAEVGAEPRSGPTSATPLVGPAPTDEQSESPEVESGEPSDD